MAAKTKAEPKLSAASQKAVDLVDQIEGATNTGEAKTALTKRLLQLEKQLKEAKAGK